MAHRLKPLDRLEGAQRSASQPRGHAALSASAGTGKTHVLTARVLRLLLSGVDPASILCLTFTKAGAAEMAGRIHARLAYWVRLKEADLGAELAALGEDPGPEARAEARTLFARLLESTGGGLRVQTIHAFAQGLLAAFPSEAGLSPGFRPLEGREEQLLARATLAEMLVAAEREGDLALIRDLQTLSLRLGEGGAEAFLRACARAPEAMAALGPREGVEARLRHVFGLPLGDVDEVIARECGDELFDVAAVRRIGQMNAQWATKGGLDRGSICAQWLAAAPAERARLLSGLHAVWAKADGDVRSFGKGRAPQDPDYAALADAAFACCARLLSLRRLAEMLRPLAAGLRAGQTYAGAYGAAKRAAGLVDFDDLIREAEKLLLTDGMGEWVRYKLDQRTDHILVDEAQDTNTSQWNIVRALTLEYFAGEGASQRHRTIFTVGDYKQAIFGFQGTDPRSFDLARAWFAREAAGSGQDFLDLSMDKSFRSSPPILEAVDRVVADLGPEAFGLTRQPNPHESNHPGRGGSVTLWLPFTDESGADEDEGEEGWIGDAVRRYAARLARQVRSWLDRPFHLESKGRPLRPEDILILVRRRGALAALLVARLHAEGVPVAGIDRLSLSEPLAVQDLLAAARFAAQPLDDLNLASLLVSPLLGWTQEELFAAAFGRGGPLWPHLRSAAPAERLAGLYAILAMADYAPPHLFFETLLSGPLDGRRRLVERLGAEARDPIEELLSSALDFETGPAASLQAFLDWFARGDVEIVRDPSAPLDAVRVMTVHGAKGLQSPVVILADACADPDRAGAPGVRLASLPLGPDGPSIPVFRPKKDELAEPLKSEVERRDRSDREEHWRLLYVALTRAEERLYVGGALGSRDRGAPAEASWYRAVQSALAGLGASWAESALWDREIRHGTPEIAVRAVRRPAGRDPILPAWLRQPAPAEERPPRPLAPSSLGEDDVSDPPPGPAQRAAAERGRLLHALFERLPGVAEAERRARALIWLEQSAGVADEAEREGLADAACAVIADPRFADLFGADALAEAPVAAVVAGGAVVSGIVDRLLVADDRILIADFKTGRDPPADAGAIPAAHLRQMAAYRAALRVIFPDRPVAAALLYTATPVLIALPDALLDDHLPAGG
ncbi:MAG: ATP-dependent helicase/nuclease subunit [Sphingomonadales bacterium]|jgi:ATP-dependent helicase/nuclease subunit A|nr:ATP-dependent helicase/nuclease subunit [Sphingomonadales bacterium]